MIISEPLKNILYSRKMKKGKAKREFIVVHTVGDKFWNQLLSLMVEFEEMYAAMRRKLASSDMQFEGKNTCGTQKTVTFHAKNEGRITSTEKKRNTQNCKVCFWAVLIFC